MMELKDFYNDGFGWICRHCESDLKNSNVSENQTHSRLLREGEAESKSPRLSSQALAKWTDKAQTTLMCPRCGIIESIDKF